ncbi:MAG: hypothetical protein E7178_01245 [Erysipelotrichaceae bacterium]|nr:hypothetical protein [Erysipelotrichaceae bacterium]
MINIFISLLFIIMSYSFFTISISIQGINRMVINAPRGIFEYSVVSSENGLVYYEQEEIKKRYLSYIEDNIHQYVDKYDLRFRFYNPSTGGLCQENCEGVEIKLSSNIAFSFSYSRTMFYEIREVRHG